MVAKWLEVYLQRYLKFHANTPTSSTLRPFASLWLPLAQRNQTASTKYA
jgi:hypothetical protein